MYEGERGKGNNQGEERERKVLHGISNHKEVWKPFYWTWVPKLNVKV